MALRMFDRALIPNSPRGWPVPPHEPELVYAFSDEDRLEMLQDPKCNKEVFEDTLENASDLHSYDRDEDRVIPEAKLTEAGLGHWRAVALED